MVEKSGVAVNVAGSFWMPTAIATIVVTRMLMSSAPGIFRAHSVIVIREAEPEDEVRRLGREDERDGHRVLGRCPAGLDDDPGVDEADEQDEQADADPDRPLERQRDGPHDRLAQADEDEERDDEALEDDDAHRPRRRQADVRTSPKATAPLIPRPAARAIGAFAMMPIAMVITPATRAVAALPPGH